MSAPVDRRRLLVAGLAAPWFVRHARAADVDRFALGVASGQPRPKSVVLWTRLFAPDLPERIDVHWEVAHDERFAAVAARGTATAEASWAHSVHVDVGNLEPARWYWYRFEALGQRSAAGRTRTAPAADATGTSLRFALASCQRYDVAHYAAWRHLSAQSLDAVVFVGDYIYESASPIGVLRPHGGTGAAQTLDQYRDRYAQYKRDRSLQAAHAACPWLVVWDDHEVENDYAGMQSQTLARDFALRRAAAYQAYWEHMPFSMAQRPGIGNAMRVVDRVDWGRLARFHLLDDRQHRDPQACPREGRGGANTVPVSICPTLEDPSRTLLGRAQERWLDEGWDPERPWNLVAQQTLMARFSWTAPANVATYWTDGWSGYPAARARLLEGIAQRKLGGAVVLGGDVHTHYVASLHREADDPAKSAPVASEFCGTSITSTSLAEARIQAALAFNPHVHYGRGDKRGAIVFDVDDKRLRAQLLGVDDPLRADSGVATLARFVVEAGRPGPQRD